MLVAQRIQSGQWRVRGNAQQILHTQAAHAARDNFGTTVFLRGVVEVSNFCRENCSYCGMRRDNRGLDRFRASVDRLAELLIHHRPPSITDLNIQTGEDPVAVHHVVLPLIRELRRHTPLGISVCLGTLNEELYQELQDAGAAIYIMKFEIADTHFYRAMQAPGRLAERLRHIRHLAQQGWHVSSGFIAGLPGQTDGLIMDNFNLAAQLPLAGCSVSPFIPGESTPLASHACADLDLTLNCMALLRLLRPGWIIPAVSALNLAGQSNGEGYRRGLRTGANLVTMNLTPSDQRGDYLLYRRDRYIMTEERILTAIDAEGLAPSTRSMIEYLRGTSPPRPTPARRTTAQPADPVPAAP